MSNQIQNSNIKTYGQVLFEATKDLKGKEQERVIKNFVQLLKQKRALRLIDKIILEFEKIWKKENGIVDIEITTAHKANIVSKLSLLSKGGEVKEKIDPDLIGGAVIKFEDVLIDGSLKHKLEILKNSLIS